MLSRRGKNRVDTVTTRRVVSPTGIIYTAKFRYRKVRQTIYKLRVTTVQPGFLLITQRIITVLPYFRVQFVLRVQRIFPHDSFMPSGSRRRISFTLVLYHAGELYEIIYLSPQR